MAKSHLVGGMSLPDATTVFKTVAEQCGDSVSRIPDGETGQRDTWIYSVVPYLEKTDGLEVVTHMEHGHRRFPVFGVTEGTNPEDIKFELGYDTDALESWSEFKRLKADGTIGKDVKYQVALPTSMAIVGYFIQPSDQPRVSGPYEARLKQEIENIAAVIPPQELAIQWDVAVEFALLEGYVGDHMIPDEIILDQLVRMSTLVPTNVEMGYHLCYGAAPVEPGGRGAHFIEPKDAGLLVKVSNAITDGSKRPVNFMHMPVPIDRDDDAFFAPMADLTLPSETQLYLGLVHIEDGVTGAERRAATASKYVKGFGVGTECGMGTHPAEQIPELLKLHHDITVPS